TAKPAFLDQLPPSGSLEGYLFPDSYQFEPNTPADQVVQRMLDDFQRHLTPAMLSAYKAQGLSEDQAVIIASIVEREAETPSERPIIASVYLNRVHRGMKLQADPTVQYSLIPALGTPVAGTYWKGGLTLADLKNPSPYNTYVVGGLPPGPICNPGLASLEAVAKPATTDYLYFVARPDGTHAFAKTLEEQEQNVAKYQQ
ncbi:MAG TPA: endolytic transglycosylase MltG, partial [Chloroflexota bacterium]|nr:endolytic transglycosylase MltG [Chloroflexota bacterium]